MKEIIGVSKQNRRKWVKDSRSDVKLHNHSLIKAEYELALIINSSTYSYKHLQCKSLNKEIICT